MKVIVSHDVDHLYLSDHLFDTFLPGLLLKSLKGWAQKGLTLKQVLARFKYAQLNRVKELHQFNKENGVQETFFFGMRNALNLSYNYKKAKPFIEYLQSEEVEIGLHGIAYNDLSLLKEEQQRLNEMLGHTEPFGIRNHYLRQNEDTKSLMEKLGFIYDSTDLDIRSPYQVSEMWEIPISVMDASLIGYGKNNAPEIKKKTLSIIEEAEQKKLPFFVVNFHDVYFSEGFPYHHEWYKWLINYLSSRSFEFITFKQAVHQLKVLN